MVEQLFTIGTSIIFLLLGFYFGQYVRQKEPVQKQQQTKKSVKHFLMKAGILEYPSQADIDYTNSGEEKVDEAREKLFREQFKP